MPSHFSVTHRDARTGARVGVLRTAHGDVMTPCFMPIATVGAVHHVSASELAELGASIVLANTYHLSLRPGTAYLAERGGLQRFMGWNGPLLTDSGGFQVFSLGARAAERSGKGFVELTEDGVRFRSHLDGSAHLLTPESAIAHQWNIGSDIAMALDVCPPQPCAPAQLRAAVATTTAWAQRTMEYHHSPIRTNRRMDGGRTMQIFGIVQGGSNVELRKESAAAITALPFDGFAIGGVAVGESTEEMRRTVELVAPLLPQDRPRYLMGVGTPADIFHAVQHGIDMFDCVLPTRDARHGRVYRRVSSLRSQVSGLDPWYETINIGNEQWKRADQPIDSACVCPTCRHHTIAYLRHLFAIGEPLGARLATLHNLAFYLGLMRSIRENVAAHADMKPPNQ